MNITVEYTDNTLFTAETGGECAKTDVLITIDERLPFEVQQERITHAIIEVYCPFLPHNKVEELTDLIIQGLDKLNKEVE